MSAASRRAWPGSVCSARGPRRQAVALAAALGGLKGPIMKVAQLLATIPDALPPEYAAELQQVAEPGAADGLGLRQAAHERRAWAGLGRRNSQASSSSRRRRPRSARCIRRVALDGAELACKLQYPDMQSAVEADLKQLAIAVRHPQAHGPGDRHHRDRRGDRRAPARGARLRARGQARRALPRHVRRPSDAIRVPRVWPELSTGRLLTHGLARRPQAARLQGRCRSTARNGSPAPCSPPGGFPSAVSASSTATRISAITPSSTRRRRRPAGHQPARLWLHPHLSAELRRRRGRSLSRPAARRRRPGRACLRDLGLSSGSRHELIDIAQYLGALHLRPAARRSRAQRRRRREAVGEYGRREAFQVHQALKRRGPVKVPREFVFMDRAAIGLGACSCIWRRS